MCIVHPFAAIGKFRGPAKTTFGLVLVAVTLAVMTPPATAQTVLPADAKATCTVSAVEFENWFVSGTVTLNGSVDPANSLTFPNIPNCTFYKWSEQMFLWLTSPA